MFDRTAPSLLFHSLLSLLNPYLTQYYSPTPLPPTPVATHFNGACQPFHFSITALEQVKEGERDLSSDDILARLEKKEDILARRQREIFWIERLNTLSPHGLNKKSELQPPLPFIIPLSDNTGMIAKIVREIYSELQLDLFGTFFKRKFITAFRRNKKFKRYSSVSCH